MPDLALKRRAVIDTLVLHAPATQVSARVLPTLGRLLFRGDGEAAKALGALYGVALPTAANRAASSGERAALWLGPDEWLLIFPESEGAALVSRLREMPDGAAHSLVDISHRQVAIEVAGPHAATLLNACVLLDLDETTFPIQAATRTIFAKAEIVLWRKAADCFHIEVWRSFVPYFAGLLAEASRGIPSD